jgi:hypothetical protein
MLRRTETGDNDFNKALAFSTVPNSTLIYSPGDGYTYWVFRSAGTALLSGTGTINVYTISGGRPSFNGIGGGAGGAVHVLSNYPFNTPSNGTSIPIAVGGAAGDSYFGPYSYADGFPYDGQPSPTRQYAGSPGGSGPGTPSNSENSAKNPNYNTHGGNGYIYTSSPGSPEAPPEQNITRYVGGGGAGGGGSPPGAGGNSSTSGGVNADGGTGGNGVVIPWSIPQIGFSHPGAPYGGFAGGGTGGKSTQLPNNQRSPNSYNSNIRYGRSPGFTGNGQANSGAGANGNPYSGGGSGVIICRTPN